MLTNDDKIVWFATDGGPNILIPSKHLKEWRGHEDGSDDYVRACEVAGTGVISVGSGQGLVLGEGESQITWYPRGTENQEGLFVEWISAEGEDIVMKYLENVPETIFNEESIIFDNDDDTLGLIGAADDGDGSNWGRMIIKLRPGKYEFTKGDYIPDSSTELTLYRLKKID